MALLLYREIIIIMSLCIPCTVQVVFLLPAHEENGTPPPPPPPPSWVTPPYEETTNSMQYRRDPSIAIAAPNLFCAHPLPQKTTSVLCCGPVYCLLLHCPSNQEGVRVLPV